MTHMITADNISKFFGATHAVAHVSFRIAPGEIVGFLGPNGAGKTTIMRLLTGYLTATEGHISIAGHDVRTESLGARAHIGYLPETPPLYNDMSVEKYLRFAAYLKDVPDNNMRMRLEETLRDCKIDTVRHQTIGTLSKGYKQRLGIAQAIIHNPEILILDEPTSGLDPQQIIDVRELIKRYEGTHTVLLSTHILSEIEQIAKRIIVINRGSIVADTTQSDLLTTTGSANLEEAFLKLTS